MSRAYLHVNAHEKGHEHKILHTNISLDLDMNIPKFLRRDCKRHCKLRNKDYRQASSHQEKVKLLICTTNYMAKRGFRF